MDNRPMQCWEELEQGARTRAILEACVNRRKASKPEPTEPTAPMVKRGSDGRMYWRVGAAQL